MMMLQLALGLLLFPGYVPLRDAIVRYDVAEAIGDGHLAVTDSAAANNPQYSIWYHHRADGEAFSRYPIGHSLMMRVPMTVFDNPRGAALVAPLIAPFTLLLFFAAARRLGARAGPALLATAAVAFGTMVFPYSTDSHDNYFQAICAVGLFVTLTGEKHPGRGAVLAGLWFGAFLNIKLWVIAALPMCAWLLPHATQPAPTGVAGAIVAWARGIASRPSLRRYALFALGALPGLVLYAWYAELRFGNLLGEIGAESGNISARPLLALAGLTIGPAKSIFLYNPLTLVCLVTLPATIRRIPRQGIGLLAGIAGFGGMTIMYTAWHGDVGWGPRYLLPLVALATLTLVELAETGVSRTTRRLTVFLFAASFLVQVVGASVHPYRYFIETGRSDDEVYADPSYAEYFKLDPSQFSSGLFGFPGTIRSSIDLIHHDGSGSAEELASWQRRLGNPGLADATREYAEQRVRLLSNPGFDTLTYWWVMDAVYPTSVRWPPWAGRVLPPIFLLVAFASGLSAGLAFRRRHAATSGRSDSVEPDLQ